MTDHDTNRAIAEALEPEPKWPTGFPPEISERRLWQSRDVEHLGNKWDAIVPRPFHEDWDAMGALLEAFRIQRAQSLDVSLYFWTRLRVTAILEEAGVKPLGDATADTIPRAVRDAVAKALGIEI